MESETGMDTLTAQIGSKTYSYKQSELHAEYHN